MVKVHPLMLVAAVIVVACTGTAARNFASQPTATDRAATTAAPQLAGVPKPTIRAVDGQNTVLPSPSDRPTALFFMASWCLPCVRAAAMLDDLYKQYQARGFRVVAIDIDSSATPEDLARFRELAGDPGYFWAIDKDHKAVKAFQIASLDATIVVDSRGQIVFRLESLPSKDALRRAMAGLFR